KSLEGKNWVELVKDINEALTEPGEWYLNKHTGVLTYLPLPEEDMDASVISAPVTSKLLSIRGTPGRPASQVRVQGLTFECTSCDMPGISEREGIADTGSLKHDENYGAATQAACNLGGVIEMEYAHDCELTNCTIRNIGRYAVRLGSGCRRAKITGNLMQDLGAAGIKINGGDAYSDRVHWNGENTITDNEIVSGGRVFASAVGVLLMHSFGNLISHNHIHDLYYSGISCGWVWGYGESITRNNRIEYNHIHTIGQGVLSDMGGIYTLGVQPGTVLRGNVIHDIKQCNYGGWCIYLDEGSSHILVEGNVCYRAGAQGFNQHYGRENVIRNNLFAFGEISTFFLGRREDHNSLTFTQNICISDGKPIFLQLPRGKDGKQGFRSDMNLFWEVGGSLSIAEKVTGHPTGSPSRKPVDLSGWQETGNDIFSRTADPQCVDVGSDDFTLTEGSPATEMGIVLTATSAAGPRVKPGSSH
ncbi:MAG: hypothetical protein CMN78_03905, partial [Spirochaetales bacterium]|nr:hypothetical protein [Spirochaetales bacterium]